MFSEVVNCPVWIRNIPATPAENQRRVWLADRALVVAGRGVLLGAEFIE